MRGTVKFFHRIKGYGIIVSPECDEDVFVHYSDICGEGYRNLYEGDRVVFELAENPGKGVKAVNVERLR